MSLRSDYEITITVRDGDFRFKSSEVTNLLPCLVGIIIYDEHEIPGDISTYAQVQAGGTALFAILRDVHPYHYAEHYVEMSRKCPTVEFEVDEYIREATDGAEAGRRIYYLKDGKRGMNDSERLDWLEKHKGTAWPKWMIKIPINPADGIGIDLACAGAVDGYEEMGGTYNIIRPSLREAIDAAAERSKA